jgi:hypothetical protein
LIGIERNRSAPTVMKRLATILAASLVAFASASHARALAQREMQQMGHPGVKMQRAQGVTLAVVNDAARHSLTVRVGPLDLPAHSSHHAVAQAPDQFLTIPFDGWITAYHPRLVDDAGNVLPNHLLHHVAFYNTRRADFLCPQKPEHIFGAGGEMNDWPANPGIGYRVHPGDRILIGTMFHNPTATNYPRTYIEVRMEYQLVAPGAPEMRGVYPAWFDVKGCGSSAYDLKPGTNVISGEFTLEHSGRLIGVGGHLHDYGQQLTLEDLTRHKTIATLHSKLDPQGHILSMPVLLFTDRGGYALPKGEEVKVTATYDNLTGKPLPEGAMGIVVGYFLPDNDRGMASLSRK